jgi:hypothetical protein
MVRWSDDAHRVGAKMRDLIRRDGVQVRRRAANQRFGDMEHAHRAPLNFRRDIGTDLAL